MVVGAGVMLAGFVVLDSLRHRAREYALRLEGAADEARRTAEQAVAARTPSPASQDVLRHIAALRDTLVRRCAVFNAHYTAVYAEPDEVLRFKRLIAHVRAYVRVLARDLADTLGYFENRSGGGPIKVSVLLSVLDEMESEVTTRGLTDDRDTAPPPEGTHVVIGPL